MEVTNIYTILKCAYKKHDFKHNRKGLEGREEIKVLPKDWINNKLPVLIFFQKSINIPGLGFLTARQLEDSQWLMWFLRAPKVSPRKPSKTSAAFMVWPRKSCSITFATIISPPRFKERGMRPHLPMEEVSKSHGKKNVFIVLENTICHK